MLKLEGYCMSKNNDISKKCANRLLGSSYNCEEEREVNDFYATNPKCVLDLLDFGIPFSKNIWEPVCGLGHISMNIKRKWIHCS